MDTPNLDYIVGNLIDDDGLEHYGVKGMRWGVRRTDAQLRRAAAARGEKSKSKAGSGGQDSPGTKARPGEFVRTSHGTRRVTKTDKDGYVTEVGMSGDARRQSIRGKVGAKNLTTKELQAYLNRAKLEQQYNALNAEKPSFLKSKGQKFLESYIDNELQKLATGDLRGTTTYKVGDFFVGAATKGKYKSKHGKI